MISTEMAKAKKYETIRELIFWSYANLAMAHTAVERNQEEYDTLSYVVRAKLFKGLRSETMNVRTIFDDEKVKLQTGQICNYCGSEEKLALDHIFAKKRGGKDDAENLIFACRSCNSSKGKKDLMEWMTYRDEFLPLMVIRRYLKLVLKYCRENEILETKIEELDCLSLPFSWRFIPIKFPKPKELKLTIERKVITSQNNVHDF